MLQANVAQLFEYQRERLQLLLVCGNLVADLLLAAVDPRIRYE